MGHIAAGTYISVPKNWGLDELENENKTRFIAVEVEVFTEDKKESVGVITYKGWLTDKALPFTVKALRAWGWKGDDLTNIDLTQEAPVVIAEKPRQDGNGTYSEISSVGRREFSLKKPIQGADLKQFAASMKAKIAAVSAGQPQGNGAKPPF